MAKTKNRGSIQNRPLYSRVSFLYQASALLATLEDKPAIESAADKFSEQGSSSSGNEEQTQKQGPLEGTKLANLQGISRRVASDLRTVSLKTQIRISPAVKHTICKFCDTLLVEGKSCTSTIENKSRGGRKPWADVLVKQCRTCGNAKRFPVDTPRQKRRPFRTAGGGQDDVGAGVPKTASSG